jgi:hypothetical protein
LPFKLESLTNLPFWSFKEKSGALAPISIISFLL